MSDKAKNAATPPATDATPPATPPLPPQLLREEMFLRDLQRRGYEVVPAGSVLDAGSPPGGGLPALARRGAALDLRRVPPTMPVLRAFQDFLEMERRQTRNKILTLTFVFAIVLLLVIGGGLLLGMTSMGGVRRSFAALMHDVRDLRDRTARDTAQTRESVQQVAAAAEKLEAALRQSRTALDAVQERVATRDTRVDDSVEGLRDVLSLLEVENTSLRRDLDKLMQNWQGRPANETAVAPDASLPAIAPQRVPLPDQMKTVEVTLGDAGADGAITFRLPIPE